MEAMEAGDVYELLGKIVHDDDGVAWVVDRLHPTSPDMVWCKDPAGARQQLEQASVVLGWAANGVEDANPTTL